MGVLNSAARAARGGVAAAAAVLALLLAGCGGGGDAAPEAPEPPTALPETLELSAPTNYATTGSAVALSSNAVDPDDGLTYEWQFGDGATSDEANPTHVYAKPGEYTVQLTLTNEAGSSVSTQAVVSVGDMAIVLGKACNAADHAGWCWQQPLPQGNVIHDYFYLDAQRGWAVGAGGTVLATADGGLTWTPQLSGTDLALTKVHFISAQVGWIASTHGQLLKTSDGGANWMAVSVGQSVNVHSLGVNGTEVAWVVSDYGGALSVTEDGGAHWTAVAAPNGAQFYTPVSATDIWAASPYFNDATLLHSTDGGTTWSTVVLPAEDPNLSRWITGLQFIDAQHGFVTTRESGYPGGTEPYVDRTTGWRTVDGGASWQALTAAIDYAGTIAWVDASHGFALSWDSNLRRTSDAGVTWQPVTLPDVEHFVSYQLHAFTPQTVVLRSSSGHVYVSHDAGGSWSERSADGSPSPSMQGLWFFDAREGLAIGADGSSTRTTDGGQTWVTTAATSTSGWRQLQFLPDASVGWVISDSGTILRSTDKGASWLSPVPQTSEILGYVTDFHFVDEQRGWAVTSYSWSNPAHIYRSIDGGSSWQPVDGTSDFGELVSVRFADAENGVAVGRPGVAMITSDGGDSWGPRPTGIDRSLNRVVFIDAQTAVAVGEAGAIVRSTDRGFTWRKIASPTTSRLTNVRFISGTTGWAVGDYGTLLTTRDGGLTWTLQTTGVVSALHAAFFVDEWTGWIVGDNGSILATATGGR